MKYFIDDENNVFAYEDDGSQDYLIGNKKPITEEEVNAILNPPPTHEELVESADAKKKTLITEANAITQAWQVQLLLGIITDDDKSSLSEWMLYVQRVQAVDESKPDNIIWPERPEEPA